MRTLSKYTGKDMFIKFGTLNVSGQGRSLEINQSADEIDVTTYGSTDKEFIVGKTEREASLEVLDDAAATAVRTAMAVGATGSLAWFPLGTASGNPKFSCASVVMKENNITYPYDDAVLMTCSLRLSGAVSETTAP